MALSGFVSTEWLAEHLQDRELRIFDVTVVFRPQPDPTQPRAIESGRPGYGLEHVPGAGFIDIPNELSEPDARFRFTLPSPAIVSRTFSRHGIGPESSVVFYAAAGSWAARAYYVAREFGLQSVAVLDGGLGKWKREGRPLSQAPAPERAATFEAKRQHRYFVGKDEVLALLGDPHARIVSALPVQSHRLGFRRPGWIPGSVNVPAVDLTDPATEGLISVQARRDVFAAAAVTSAERVITYCGGGIAAATTALALESVGGPPVAIYDGSLSEWTADEQLPLELR
jgi:thiosulfate/3-mercaptopyruvate sulfurtransferase